MPQVFPRCAVAFAAEDCVCFGASDNDVRPVAAFYDARAAGKQAMLATGHNEDNLLAFAEWCLFAVHKGATGGREGRAARKGVRAARQEQRSGVRLPGGPQGDTGRPAQATG